MTSIYRPPESEVTVRDLGNINLFQRFNIWFVLILILLTLGLYIVYWLHTRTKILNQIVHHNISTIFVSVATLLFVLSFVIQVVGTLLEEAAVFPNAMQYFTYLPMLELISNILILVWVFKFRNQLQKTFSSSEFDVGIIPTFFFQIIYLQYKINRLIS